MALVDPVIRSSIVLIVGLLLSVCLAKRSAALRHRVLAAALLASALVIPFSVVLPALNVPWPARMVDPPPAVTASVVGSQPATFDPPPPQVTTPESTPSIAVMWLVGVVIAAGILMASLVRIGRIAARASRVQEPRWLEVLGIVAGRYGLAREIVLSRTASANLLATWGILRPQVLLPHHSADWSLERVRLVLAHELAHIRRHDWLVQLSAEMLRALFWFNPLVWIVCSRLRRESEQACDDEVIGSGVDGREYAAHLVEIARQCRRPGAGWAPATPMAHPSTLERRIAAMLNPRIDRHLPSRRAIATLCVVLLLVALPVAIVRARQTPPPAQSTVGDATVRVLPSVEVTRAHQVKPVTTEKPPRVVAVAPRVVPIMRTQAGSPLTGTIYDVTGGVMPGVQVTLVDANQDKWTAVSNASGRFTLPAVGPGKFVLEVSLAGFRTLRQEFELRDPRDWNRSITLQVGELQETITVRDSRVAPVAQPTTDQPVRVGGNVRAPTKVRDVRPLYPASMREAGLTGKVPIEAIIGRDGTVSSVRVLSAQVHPDFAIAAVDAVRQWRFTPTLLNGVAVEVVMRVSVTFDLEN